MTLPAKKRKNLFPGISPQVYINEHMKFYLRFLMLSLAAWLLSAAPSWAQDYVILPSGEQLEGKVVRKFDYNQYSKLKFIEHTGVHREFSPEEIKGFGLQNGRIFQVKLFQGMEQPVFVQRVFTGKINLIQYDGRFFLENDHQTLELKEQFTKKEIEGRYYSAHEKPYIGVLNIMMAGKCGTELNYFINYVRLVEESLIGILKKYHECEELDYEIQVLQIPLLRVSPLIKVGVANSMLVPHSRTVGRKDVLGNTFFPQVQASMRLHSFRNAPRTTLEIGVGYQLEKTSLFAELQEPGLLITGEERVRATSLTVPISYHYTFYNLHVLQPASPRFLFRGRRDGLGWMV